MATQLTQVHFFKTTGKWYTTEPVQIPIGTAPWEVRKVIESYLDGRLRGMTAVITDAPALDNLWGFPISLPDIGQATAEEIRARREGGP